MDTWAPITCLWLWWIIQLQTWVYNYLFESLLSILLGIYQEMELLDHMVIVFWTFLKNCCYTAVFHSSCTILQSHQQCIQVPISPHPHQQLLFSGFFIIAILVDAKCYLIVGLSCISLMISDIEHLLIYLLTSCVFSLKKYLFRSFELGSFVVVELQEFFIYSGY